MMMSDYKRQHPFMILMSLITQLKSLFLPFVLVLLFQNQGGGDFYTDALFLAITGGILVLSVLYSIFKWFFYRYSLKEDALIVRSGVFIKKRRYIKPERVQTTSMEAGILLRMRGLVSLKVETAGSKIEAEFTLEALKPEDAKAIQNYLKGDVKETFAEEEEAEPSFIEIGLKDLFLAALTSGNVGIAFLFIFAVVSQFIEFVPDEFVSELQGSLIGQGLLLIFIIGVLVLIASWIISIIRYMLRFSLFKVTMEEDELTITRGLIVKRTFRVKKHRIQAVNIVEGILREPFSFATVECEVAGGGSYEPGHKITLFPLIRKNNLQKTLKSVLPEYSVEFNLSPLPKRAMRRYIVRALILYVPIIPVFFFYPISLLVLITLPIALYFGILRYKNGGYEIKENMLIQRSRMIAKTTVIAKRRAIQDITLTQTILQKHRNLVHFDMTVMSTPSHKTFRLKDLPSSTMEEFNDWLQKNTQNS
jgi:putative membrane protein